MGDFFLILKSIKGYLLDKFKFTFDKSEDLQQKAYQFYKEKTQMEERKMVKKSNTVSSLETAHEKTQNTE
jgi:hypothetical protein